MTTQPRLSELIRKGAKMVDGRQCTEDYMRYDDDGQVCLCVLGAAYLGLTDELPGWKIDQELSVWDTLKDATGYEDKVLHTVAQDNDISNMTFEEIAADLEAKGL